MRSICRTVLALAAVLLPGVATVSGQETLTIMKAARVYCGDGRVIENGMVSFKGGRIVEVGAKIDVPEGAEVVDLGEGCITPGLIDASTDIGLKSRSIDERSEIIPEDAAIDGVDLFDKSFERLSQGGVTSVYIGGGTAAVIGPRGVVLKTMRGLKNRVLAADGAVRAVLTDAPERGNRRPFGSNPPSLKSRRPTTKMGAVFVFRDAMSRTLSGDADSPSGKVLTELLEGKRRMHAMADVPHEFAMARAFSREFGLKFTIERASRVHECLDVVKSEGYSVIYGPAPLSVTAARRARTKLSTPAILKREGIPFALTAAGATGAGDLARQCTLAIRHGLSVGDAVIAVTSQPAKLLGVESRVGTIAAGKDADVVGWTGDAFGATSRPKVVFIGGTKVKGRSY